jgi:hypothetical protein
MRKGHLATSFVVVLTAACQREPPTRNPPALMIRVRDRHCEEVERGTPYATKGRPVPCPKAAIVVENGQCAVQLGADCSNAGENTCNPPGPQVVDCPPDLAPSASASASTGP